MSPTAPPAGILTQHLLNVTVAQPDISLMTQTLNVYVSVGESVRSVYPRNSFERFFYVMLEFIGCYIRSIMSLFLQKCLLDAQRLWM